MDANFWHSRWQQNKIGFHQERGSAYLRTFFDKWALPRQARVFVPLCGKSQDMLWLRDQGCEVYGVELSPVAVAAFFEENGLTVKTETIGDFSIWRSDGITLFCGDFFRLQSAYLPEIDGIYDRASLIALPSKMRLSYVSHLLSLTQSATRILLITLDYPQAEMEGPPFAVTTVEMRELFDRRCQIHVLATTDALAENHRFALTRLEESAYLLLRS